MSTAHPERVLAAAARALTWETMPLETRESIRRLFLDWVGSALAGAPSDSARILEFVVRSGSDSRHAPSAGEHPPGTATILTSLSAVAPLTAALVNGASSHVVEMDDLHNASIYHPATCIFPALFAAAEAAAATPSRFLAAAVAGYEVSIRVGEALGPEHYAFFHTTGTAGTLGAAVAVGHLLGLDEQQMLWAIGSAATQAAGLWQFLAEGSMSKPLHTAKASYNGALAAYLAEQGFTGPEHSLCGERGLLAATTPAGALLTTGDYSEDLRQEQRSRLVDGIVEELDGSKAVFGEYRTPNVSIKYHASCRHTHPSVDALLSIMQEHRLRADDLEAIRAHVYTGAYDLLNGVAATSPWAAKFSLPFCLAQAALQGRLSLDAFNQDALTDPRVTHLMGRVSLSVDPSLDDSYPRFWPAWVEVETKSGSTHTQRIDTPKGDPENPVTDAELDAKFLLLASAALQSDDADRLLARLRDLDALVDMTQLLAGISPRPSACVEPADLPRGDTALGD